MALYIGARAVLMALSTYWNVANMGLAAARAGGRTTANSEIKSSKAARDRILVLRDNTLRLRGMCCGAVYLVIAITSVYNLILARLRTGECIDRVAQYPFCDARGTYVCFAMKVCRFD